MPYGFNGSIELIVNGLLYGDAVEDIIPEAKILEPFRYASPRNGASVLGNDRVYVFDGTLEGPPVDFNFVGGGLLDVLGRTDCLAIRWLSVLNLATDHSPIEVSGNLLRRQWPNWDAAYVALAFANTPFILGNMDTQLALSAGVADTLRLNPATATIPYRMVVVGAQTYAA